MIHVCVAIALPSRQEVVELALPEGSTIAQAIAAAGFEARFPEVRFAWLEVGVWGERAVRATVLREGDRVELYRPLEADPKDQRRRRVRPRTSPRSRSGP